MNGKIGKFNVISKNLTKVEAEAKARGELIYPNDVALPNMLHLKVLRSPYAHALVKKIDTTKAEQLPGVKAVFTHKDVPKHPAWRSYVLRFSASTLDSHILEKEVRHVGDRVAAVVATTPEIAEEALGLVDVKYEELPAVLNAVAAYKPDAPLVHKTIMRGDKEHKCEKNVCYPIFVNKGDVEKGFKEADIVVEEEFKVGRPNNIPLERSSCVCRPYSGGRLEIWTQSQSIHGVRMDIAYSLGIPQHKVKVHRMFLGGAFGAHILPNYIEFIVAFAAWKLGVPVKGEQTREEEFYTYGRHPGVFKLKVGAKKDGAFTAMDMWFLDDTGAYAPWGELILGLECGWYMSMYRCPNIRFDGYTLYTNTPPCTAMRGAGNPQQNFGVEQMVDIIAEKLDMDPIELRLKNHIRLGDTFYGQGPDVLCTVESCGTEQLLEEGSQMIGWKNRKSRTPYADKPWIKRGIGMARGFHTSGTASSPPSQIIVDYSGAMVKLNEDGTANLITASADLGAGNNAAQCAIVAEEMGLRYEDVIFSEGDTDNTLYDCATHATRGSFCGGLACRAAAAEAKKTVMEWAARILGVSAGDLLAKDGFIYIRTSAGGDMLGITVKDVVSHTHDNNWGTAAGVASVKAPACPPCYLACFVELDVDTMTGEVKLLNAIAGGDVGTPINLHAVRGQAIGGLQMGLGYALVEDTIIDQTNGRVRNPGFTDYKSFTALDMPKKVQTFFADTYEPTGPFGAKGMGESATNPVAAAVANAIYNAVGIRTFENPITPERILNALNKAEVSQKVYAVR